MNGLSYIINTQIAIIVLYLLYIIAFRKKTAPVLARIYLLSIIPVSAILAGIKVKIPILFSPLYKITDFSRTSQLVEAGNNTSSEAIALFENITLTETNAAQSISAGEVFGYIYIIGLSLTILVTIFDIYRTWRMVINRDEDENEMYAFSFMGKEYLSGNIENRLLQAIRIHENTHARQYHHIDLIYMLICRNIFWFNPIVWHINYLLKEVHEYQADKKVIESGYSSSEYAQMLINVQIGDITPYTIHSFSYKSTKNRIIMLKKKNSKSGYLRMLYVIPVVATLFLVICCKNQQKTPVQQEPETPTTEITVQKIEKSDSADTIIVQTTSVSVKTTIPEKPTPVVISANSTAKETTQDIYYTTEKPAQFPGGDEAMKKFLNGNFKYPEEAQEKGLHGKVVVKFVVTENGSIEDIEILRSVDKLLDDEAIRLVKLFPKWIPAEQDGKAVKVYYQFPVSFVLQ